VSGCTVASETMSDFALRALEVLLFEEISDQKVIAVWLRALEVASRITSLKDHLPLEPLPFSKVLLVQENFEVVFSGERLFTTNVWAFDWELVH